jgi:hypothetical protein
MKGKGLFDEDERLSRLIELGDPWSSTEKNAAHFIRGGV